MTAARTSVGIGSWLIHDGEPCQVVELHGDTVVIENGRGGASRVRLVDLLRPGGQTATRLANAETPPVEEEPGGVRLALAGDAAIRQALERAGHVREALTGYRSGSAEIAAPGEPRPLFAADVPLLERYRSKAEELGVSTRTMQRWVAAYQAGGEAGLVAAAAAERRRPVLARVDPRWADACRAVLEDQVAESNVSKKLTLLRVAARLEREFGAGVVPAPRGGATYRALDEIARGRGSFGASAKARRSIANRPPASYGRLRASLPAEYVLLDTTRLDVFAMEPVTLRWIQVELTIAMDLYTRCVTGLRCSPVSTKSVDVASVLFETIQPRPASDHWPAAGTGSRRRRSSTWASSTRSSGSGSRWFTTVGRTSRWSTRTCPGWR
ncbi:helix-turn-helix domain-containing protein [Pseudofrankia sp. BMG5.37]|uniref:helix-turn-helix domain-containing protein n=1 Tax=Pseudofrankia sp. BMG5.37 TaxID=3050035 RepID=UPI002896288F|nr:helix-turn-helix domain-containing protein [Pseudofrankia sp. BMG5.37]MDT3444003.1 hypothetical protein [Pseudofrankia sp. BMG5.37]